MSGLATDVETLTLTVDGGRPVDLHRRPFETFSPQVAVRLPADNPFGVAAQSGTFTAWGWIAWLKNLPRGRHTVRTETTWVDGSEPHVIALAFNVVAGGDA
jgi:hypothetical protein